MYGMTNSGKLFSEELTNWLIYESGFNHSKCQISVYYNNAPDGTNLVLLSYVCGFVYWYIFETLVKYFVDTLEKIFHVKFLLYANWFISIKISQLKNHYISVDEARYDTSVVEKYLDTATIK